MTTAKFPSPISSLPFPTFTTPETREAVATTLEWVADAVRSGIYDDTPSEPTTGNRSGIIGINVDLLNLYGTPSREFLKSVSWVRLVFNVSMLAGNTDLNKAFELYDPFIRMCNELGVKVILVITHQTYGEGRDAFWPWPDMNTTKWVHLGATLESMLGTIAAHYGDQVAIYQIWNEVDAKIGAPKSVPMHPADYRIILSRCTRAIRNNSRSKVITSGMVDNGPIPAVDYLKETFNGMQTALLPDGIAIHPYGRGNGGKYQHVGPVIPYVKAFQIFGLPLYITEFGVTGAQQEAQADMLDYYTYFLDGVDGLVEVAAWYALSDYMDSCYGFYDTINELKQYFYRGLSWTPNT